MLLVQQQNNKHFDLLFFTLGLLLVSGSTLSIATSFNMQMLITVIGLFLYVITFMNHVERFKNFDMSVCLSVPLFLSVMQNIYLGFVVDQATSTQIQIAVILNVLFSFFLIIGLLLHSPHQLNHKFLRFCIMVMTILVVYGLAISLLFGSNTISILSSLRNIICPMVFVLLGYLSSEKVNFYRFGKYVLAISFFVILFGFYERYINPNIWLNLNIMNVWLKKGIPVSLGTLLPANFYSSEMINGEQVRRMASSFADPVNLGTFLFFSFATAWLMKKKVMMILLLLTSVLAISKGAIIGIMIFAVICTFYYAPKVIFVTVAALSSFLGVGFIIYSMSNSTQSLFAHVGGLTSAIVGLPSHPFGHGLGNVGVLGGLFATEIYNGDISESGMGVVIGQLGIIGLVLYIVFFTTLFIKIKLFEDKREKVFALSIFLSIAVNIMFNEVALSPNSSAVYFIALGILIKKYPIKKDINQEGMVIDGFSFSYKDTKNIT